MSLQPIEAYQVGWVCALPKEMAAARAMLDEEHGTMTGQDQRDGNNYVLGRIHGHNVVIACLPNGIDGTNAAAIVGTNMLRTFQNLRFGFLVGIGGGIPNLDKGVDIRLGDVVVGRPEGTRGGLVQYDKGKSLEGGQFELKGFLNKPPDLLLTALSSLEAKHEISRSRMSEYLDQMTDKHHEMHEGYSYPGVGQDCLYCSHRDSPATKSCGKCDNGRVRRRERKQTAPVIHYGIIASGNQVIKDAIVRDQLGKQFAAKCVEMEAAGLKDDFPWLVIRGVCDYADAHKNDSWHRYAAVTASAYAKELLSIITPKATDIPDLNTKNKHAFGTNLFEAPDITNSLFVGRETELQEMESILQPLSRTSTRRVLVLGGMGGIGKTQLAVKYAKIHQNSYTSTFWLNAASEVSLNQSLRRMAYRIFSPEDVSKWDDGQLRVHLSNWFSEVGNNRWLLIFDNHDDPDQYALNNYYPSANQGSIMVTTRQPDEINGERIRVKSMTKREDSLRILSTRSRRKHVESDPDALKLAERLGGLPLALATAGAFLSQSALSFSKYLAQYEAKWGAVDSGIVLPDYPSRTLDTAWDLSFKQVEQQDPRAADLLKFLAYFDHKNIWYGLLRSKRKKNRPPWFSDLTSDEMAFTNAMQTLARYCFVEAHHDTESYSLHVRVHDWTLNSLNSMDDETRYWLALGCVTNHIDSSDWDELSSLRFQRFVPHALRLIQGNFQALEGENAQLHLNEIVSLAWLLHRQTKYTAAAQVYELALAECEKTRGPEHPSALGIVNSLASLYEDQGKLALAEAYYERALAGYKKALGPEHTSTLSTMQCLGVIYSKQGKLALAEEYYELVLARKKETLGPQHTSTLGIVYWLASLYKDQGRLAIAEEYYKQALAGYKKALGLEHTYTLDTIHSLGILYGKQGDKALAEEHYEMALAGYQKTLGPEHIWTLGLMINLANLYVGQGKEELAKEYYIRALAGYKEALGLEHTSTLNTIQCLGILYAEQGELELAEKYLRESLDGHDKASLSETISGLIAARNLGLVLSRWGRPEEAKIYLQRALEGRTKVLGPDHPDTLAVVNDLENLGAVLDDGYDEPRIDVRPDVSRKRDLLRGLLRLKRR